MPLRRLTVVTALPMLLALGACGQDGQSAYAGGPASPAASDPHSEGADEAEPEDAEEPNDEAREDPDTPPDDLTPPGSRLSFGERATIATTSLGDPDATLDYTVNGVTAPKRQPTSYSTTLHIAVTVTATETVSNLLVLPMFEWQVIDDQGASSVLGFDDACTAEVPDSMTAGESVDICVAVSVDNGSKPAEVHYSSSSGDTASNPIVWTR